MNRRAALLSLSTLALACRRRAEASPELATSTERDASMADAGELPFEVLDLAFPDELGGEKRCVVLVPRKRAKDEKLPLLVALHGMGETVSPRAGAYGWLESYRIDRTLDRLAHPPLEGGDFGGMITRERLDGINAWLGQHPFRGMVIACPYVPRGMGDDVPFETYGKWLGDRLLPRLRAETPIFGSAKSTSIDGVSMGGLTALKIGLDRPDLFGVIGALQPAIHESDPEGLADELQKKLAGRPLRLVTSRDDFFRPAIKMLHAALDDRKVTHELFVAEGNHSYEWNKGPGGYEMLLFHDRAVAR